MAHSIAVVILALNEAPTVRMSYTTYKNILRERQLDHEIFIVNDGSSDRTGEIADEISREDPLVKVLHHQKPLGMGFGYNEAYQLTEKEYFMFTGAYDADRKEDINAVMDQMGKTDVVLIYICNPEIRPFMRRALSSIFVKLTNLITGMNIKYYNGMQLCRTSCLKTIQIRNKHTFSAEIAIKLIKKMGCSFVEIPILTKPRKVGRKSKAVSLKNVVDAIRFYLFLIYDLYFTRK